MAGDKKTGSTQGSSAGGVAHAAAAGWGALASTFQNVLHNKGVVRNSLSLLQVNQPNGFDCPGCAWPEPDRPSTMEFCENGAKAVTFETTSKRVTPEFFAQWTVSELAKQTDHWLENQGRLTHPMKYDAASDRYVPISWEAAFSLIGDRLKALPSPDDAIFYTSGRTSNEAAFLWQLFARKFGTNNLPDCSNLCHESSGCALGESIGVGKGTVRLEDFHHADAIFVIGQNPGTNHPRMLSELEQARLRGARIVSVNPLKEAGLLQFTHPKHVWQMMAGKPSAISSHYYQVLVGGDLAMLTGMCKAVFAAEAARPGQVLDQAFIAQRTSGFEAFRAHVEAAEWSVIETQSGLSRRQIEEAADVYLGAERSIFCWAMGLTQHKHAVPTIQYIVNLLLLRGQFMKPGAGVCPVRGHSNVQGDRTMGIYEKPKPEFLDALKRVFHFEPPREHGLDVVGAIQAMAETKAEAESGGPGLTGGNGKVFIGLGGNFAAATPDTHVTAAALRKCTLTAHVSTKLNRSHLVVGRDALILPCLGRTEIDLQAGRPQKVTVEDSMSQVHASQGKNPPASDQLKSEPAIVAGIALASLPPQQPGDPDYLDWRGWISDYSRIRAKIEQTLPALFQDFNAKIERPGGFYLGNPTRDGVWNTADGKARFLPHAIPDLRLPPGRLRLMTIRSHDQFNTTIYALDDRYRNVFNNRMALFLNADDVREQGLRDGQRVDLTSHTLEDGSIRTAAGFQVVVYDIPKGCAAAYFPETNGLVSKDSFADRSRTPLSKFIPISIQPAAAP